MIQPVILCGGSGKRLWPVSRPSRPKPFLRLTGERSLFQQAISRISHSMFSQPIIVCGEQHAELAAEQAKSSRLVVEPAPRDTATAIALAAHLAREGEILLVCPSDHKIGGNELFRQAIAEAAELATRGLLVCLGIQPARPETGYGYITVGDSLDPGYEIASFLEKPDADKAAALFAQKDVFWNAGIFVFRASDFLAELDKFRPATSDLVRQSVERGKVVGERFYPSADAYLKITGESVDYAVFEHSENTAVVTTAMDWSDVGNWHSLMASLPSDEQGNVSEGTTRLKNCRNVMVHSDGPRVSTIGLEDIIIVVDGDEILVISPDCASKLDSYLDGDLE